MATDHRLPRFECGPRPLCSSSPRRGAPSGERAATSACRTRDMTYIWHLHV